MTKKTIFKIASFLPVFFLFLLIGSSALAEVAAPIILNTSLTEADNGWRLSVNGLTAPENSVSIYINGSYDGLANISENDDTLYNFSYQSGVINKISPLSVMAIAKSKNTSELSPAAEAPVDTIINNINPFKPQPEKTKTPIIVKPAKIQEKTAPPTLISPAGQTNDLKPLISGFAENFATIKLFIDEKVIAEISTKKSSSETFSFEYKPTMALATGTHSLYALATEKNKSESEKSNILSFSIKEEVVSAKQEVLGIKESSSTINSSSTVSQETSTPEIATTNTNNKTKGSLFNTILFIIFILSVFVWVFAIGKEIKREKEKIKEDKKE